MQTKSTILLDKRTINMLKNAKAHPRQSYDELITEITKVYTALKKRNQYDEFLHKIQQPKMKELWDNDADKAWEHA